MLRIYLIETFAKCFQDKCVFKRNIRKYTHIYSFEQKKHIEEKPEAYGMGYLQGVGGEEVDEGKGK